MLLADLKTEREKEAFLGLAYQVAKADGRLDYAETVLISMYRQEMGLGNGPNPLPQSSVSDLCHVFIDEHSKSTVFLNLFSLAQADGCNSLAQQGVLEAIRQELPVSKKEAKQVEEEMNIIKARFSPNYLD